MNNSYWYDSTKDVDMDFEKLNEDIETDECVIGSRYCWHQYSL